MSYLKCCEHVNKDGAGSVYEELPKIIPSSYDLL